MASMGTVEELAALVEERGPAVVLTGAGMSTESGIPDFRSASGIWAEVDPFEVASIEAFHRDPLRVWRWYGPRIGGLLAAAPNPGHVALAGLERDGHVRAVVTQNIDMLHTRAGSVDVVEVHGSIRRFECLACEADGVPLDEVLQQLETREAPECVGCGAILKPGVVMFGELLPAQEMARAEELVPGDGAPGRGRILARRSGPWPACRPTRSARTAPSQSSTSRRRPMTTTQRWSCVHPLPRRSRPFLAPWPDLSRRRRCPET